MQNNDAFKGRLLPREKVLWSGRPGQGIILTRSDALLIPFSLMWGGFAVFWEASVLSTHAPLFFALWGVPFVLAGLFITVGRFLLDAWLRGRILYALTDRRILFLRSRPWPAFKAVRLDTLPEATLNEGSDGRGTIRFGQQARLWAGSQSRNFGALVPSLDPTPQFISIPDVQRVFDLVQERTGVAMSPEAHVPSPRWACR